MDSEIIFLVDDLLSALVPPDCIHIFFNADNKSGSVINLKFGLLARNSSHWVLKASGFLNIADDAGAACATGAAACATGAAACATGAAAPGTTGAAASLVLASNERIA